MLEYSFLNWLLVAGLVLGCTVRIIPGPQRRQNLIELCIKAYQTRYHSFYFLLNSPFP